MNAFLHDLRIGARVLIKEKSFSILALAILALGICGVTTQFSMVLAFLLRGLPVAGGHVTANFFSLLRVKPAFGRDFTAADNRPLNETERVTIISDAMWETEFARDPSILGRTFRLNGAPATVIGVMPRDFQFTRD